MSTIGPTIKVKGELRASEDLTLEGRIEGSIVCEKGAVVVTSSGDIKGNILASDITVFGRTNGQLVALDVVDIRAEATVAGQVISKRFILNDGARFDGHVDPQHLEAAMRLFQFQERQTRVG
jgi:cytoskeletal protein CcmA (bactofilin family)